MPRCGGALLRPDHHEKKKKSWENEDRTFPSPLLWSRKTAKHKILDLEWTRANMNLHSDYAVDALV